MPHSDRAIARRRGAEVVIVPNTGLLSRNKDVAVYYRRHHEFHCSGAIVRVAKRGRLENSTRIGLGCVSIQARWFCRNLLILGPDTLVRAVI